MRFLFPFTSIFKSLKLENRWWHRLALVIFFVAFLAVGALIVAVIVEDVGVQRTVLQSDSVQSETSSPSSTPTKRDPETQAVPIPAGAGAVKSSGLQLGETLGHPEDRRLAAVHETKWSGIAWYFAALLALFYLPQIAYRLLLYVIFGSSESINEPETIC